MIEDVSKLRIDAENILTWEIPKGDPLTVLHLQRFAKAVITLLKEIEDLNADMKLIVDKLANTDHEQFCGAWNNYPEDCDCSFKEANEAFYRHYEQT
jgi:hypothetical protein